MSKRAAIRGVKAAMGTAKYLQAKDCGCSVCKAARRLLKQLKPVQEYLATR